MTGKGRDRSTTSQALISMIVFVFQLSVTTDASTADEYKREARFYRVETASLIGNVTMVKLVKDQLDCAFLCLRFHPNNCFSFNFGLHTVDELHICELSDSERAVEPHKMQSRKGFDYFGMENVVSHVLNKHLFASHLNELFYSL